MKKAKIAAAISAALLCMSMLAAPVMAQEIGADEPQVTLEMDKGAYEKGDPITATVTVVNTTSTHMSDINIEVDIPEGYQTEDGKTGTLTLPIEQIAKGGSVDRSVTFVPKKETNKPEEPETQKPENPNDKNKDDGNKKPGGANTGDPSNILFWCGLALSGGTVVFLLWKKRKTGLRVLSLLLVVALTGTMLWIPEFYAKAAGTDGDAEQMGNQLSYEGYELKWSDEFDGTDLNRDDWNVELHDPGWVNAELQAYVDSPDNIFIQDGKLVLRPIQTKNEDGTYSYTSGRVNTQNKHDYTYGLFVAKAKVPTGRGYLPAFWMMPQDENLYGQWPRCGEMDIMEVHGSDTSTTYGTIHYGNPHDQKQGTYTISDGADFGEDFHEFALEWMPGQLIWYVDGVEFYRTNDWYSTTEGQGTLTYPAPFDQPFHVILNLAVGGSWVGYPDDETFESSDYEIDYVKIYQKTEGYDDSNVKAPEKEPVFDGEIEDQNYIANGDFSLIKPAEPAVAEKSFKINGKENTLSVKVSYSVPDTEDWEFLTALEGEATAEAGNKEINIITTNEGTVDYSVQLVQAGLPMQKGAFYKVSFDAYADAERTMQTKISAPDHNWAVYWGPETIDLTTQKQTFTYDFQMTGEDDANGRLEFNMGATGSTAGIHITNVKVEKTGYEEIPEDTDKKVLADGNYIYNGSFQEGDAHMGSWEFTHPEGTEISVTDLADGRRLKIVAPEGTSEENPVTIFQKNLALTAGDYAFSFDAQGDNGKLLYVSVAGNQYTETLDETMQTFAHTFTFTDAVARTVAGNRDIEFKITSPGTYYLDNIRLEEDSLLKNGSFNAGFTGYEPYIDGSASATYVVDSLNEENAANFGISNTGDQDWKIQLIQNNLKMEKGQWYRLSLKAKSTKDRKLKYVIQQNGNLPGKEWIPYSKVEFIDVTSSWQTYSQEFQMTENTDLESQFSINMGAVNGIQITDKHDVFIDDILLEKIDAPEIPEQPAGENMLENGDFSEESAHWDAELASGDYADVSFTNNQAVFDIKDVGSNDWDVKLKYAGKLTLEAGAEYQVNFKVTSTKARKIKLSMMTSGYKWYAGDDISLNANEELSYSKTFTIGNDGDGVPLPTSNDIDFAISMGEMGDNTPISKITFSDFELVKLSGGEGPDGPGTPDEPSTSEENMLKVDGWSNASSNSWDGYDDQKNGTIVFNITDIGDNPYSVQISQSGIELQKNHTYKVSFKASATKGWNIIWELRDPENSYHFYTGCGGETPDTLTEQVQTFEKEFTVDEASSTVEFVVQMGKIGDNAPNAVITLSDFMLIDVTQ